MSNKRSRAAGTVSEPCNVDCVWIWESSQWTLYSGCPQGCQCDFPTALMGVIENTAQVIKTTTPCYRLVPSPSGVEESDCEA